MTRSFQILAAAGILLFGASQAAEAAGIYEVPPSGAALHVKPDAGSRVVDRARKGWKLHVCNGTTPGEWAEICEIDSGDGAWYVYRKYGLPGENVFVRVADLESPAPRLAPRAQAGEAGQAAALVPKEALCRQADDFVQGLVRLKVAGSSVRLRRGPGSGYEEAGVANEGGGGWHSELIASRQTSSGDGRKWYHVLYVLEQQEETAYLREESFIRADFVRPASLTPHDRERIENDRFGILAVSPKGLASFSLGEALTVSRASNAGPNAGPEERVSVPAGTRLCLFSIPYRLSGQGNRLFVTLWEPLDAARIRRIGSLPLDELEALQGYDGEQAVRRWIASRR